MELEYLDTIESRRFEDGSDVGEVGDNEEDQTVEGENESEEWDAWEGLKARPERYAPLGANDSDKEYSSCGGFPGMDEK